MIRRPPNSTLFPTTPLFRSHEEKEAFFLTQMARHYRQWIDEPLPELDNHTPRDAAQEDRKSTRLNSSHGYISYAVFCLKKKKKKNKILYHLKFIQTSTVYSHDVYVLYILQIH